MPTPLSGYIYLIGSERFGWYKIGRSSVPHVRISNIGILLPFKIDLFAVWSTENQCCLEAFLHEKFSEFQINGEWFAFGREKMLEVIDGSYPWKASRTDISNVSFSNIEKDHVIDGWKAEKNRLFQEAVSAYLADHNLEATKDNKRLAIEAIKVVREKERPREQRNRDKMIHSKAGMS
jgi:hypothetical protein